MNDIICIGSASKDIFFPTDAGVFFDTPEDITSQRKVAFEMGAKYQVEDRFEAVGGVAANCAQGLSRLGISATCYSSIGDDDLGDWVLDELHKEQVSTALIEKKPGAQTDLSAILVFTQNGERTIFYNRDANEMLVVDPTKIQDSQWVFISALNGDWKRNMGIILQEVASKHLKLAVNPGQRNMRDDVTRVIEAVRRADVLLLNKDEAIDLLMGMHEVSRDVLQDEQQLLKRLHEVGAKIIGLTDGKRGAWAFDGMRMLSADVLGYEPLDSTGAGDAFGSGFLAAHMKGQSLEQSLRWGIANGSNVVRFFGSKEGLLREEKMQGLAEQVQVKTLI